MNDLILDTEIISPNPPSIEPPNPYFIFSTIALVVGIYFMKKDYNLTQFSFLCSIIWGATYSIIYEIRKNRNGV